ncbi:MAG: hypothetical protein GX452_03880 [Ignavibacteriales bacterium]|nr:hypothetical protein [Ignavibacteriales bacterium]
MQKELKRTNKKRPNLTTVKNAIEKSSGIKREIYQNLQISRTTFYEICKKHPEINELIENKADEVLDFAESKLIEQIEAGNLTAIIFFLKCKGKKRGYVERTELEVNPEIGEINTIRIVEYVKEGCKPES